MKIVIDIPEKYKELLDNGEADGSIRKSILNAIINGTPLPKGHGELIDRGQALNECYNISVDGERFKVVQYETLLGVPTIIEAEDNT